MIAKRVKVPAKKEKGQFPCECGRAFATAEKFSDHVHKDHAEEIGWGAIKATNE